MIPEKPNEQPNPTGLFNIYISRSKENAAVFDVWSISKRDSAFRPPLFMGTLMPVGRGGFEALIGMCGMDVDFAVVAYGESIEAAIIASLRLTGKAFEARGKRTLSYADNTETIWQRELAETAQ